MQILTVIKCYQKSTCEYFHKYFLLLFILTGIPTKETWGCPPSGLNVQVLDTTTWTSTQRWTKTPSVRKWGHALFAFGSAPFPAFHRIMPQKLNNAFLVQITNKECAQQSQIMSATFFFLFFFNFLQPCQQWVSKIMFWLWNNNFWRSLLSAWLYGALPLKDHKGAQIPFVLGFWPIQPMFLDLHHQQDW